MSYQPSPAQRRYMLEAGMPRLQATLDALIREGFILPQDQRPGSDRRPLGEKGMTWLLMHHAKKRKRLIADHPGLSLIGSDEELMRLLERPGVEIYVYRGSVPMVVFEGNGQKPLALLDPESLWRIEVAGTAGRFLRRVAIVGHKGSYGYRLK